MMEQAAVHDGIIDDSSYAGTLNARLHAAWLNVLERRAPMVAQSINTVSEMKHDIDNGDVFQAITIWFHLQQILREIIEIREIRQSQHKINSRHNHKRPSFSSVLENSKDEKADFILEILNNKHLKIGPTITAHPTEAKRVSVLEIHRRIYHILVKFDTFRWGPREISQMQSTLEAEIDLLWLTGELRLERPTLAAEIDWGLQFYKNSLFAAIPRVFESFEIALISKLGMHEVDHFDLKFHSWIGGDRDGNPNVTTQITQLALSQARKTVIELYSNALKIAASQLSLSNEIYPLPQIHNECLDQIVNTRADDAHSLRSRNPNELFRQALTAMDQSLLCGGYKYALDFIEDLKRLESALTAIDAKNISDKFLRPLRWQASVFGFRAYTLDIRQNSDVVTAVLQEVWDQSDKAPQQFSLEWSARIRKEVVQPELFKIDRTKLSEQSNELLSLLSLMNDVQNGADPNAIGPFILSMTRSADDLLAVLLLARYAGFGAEKLSLKVVPLFETIDDLRAAPQILKDVLEIPLANRSLRDGAGQIEIMLGYSDSNKDGGYLCSSWTLDKSQRAITRAIAKYGLKPKFFHGRGGSVSRGGAPTDRAIAAQPNGTLNGMLRLTEQGEVVSSKYANISTAASELEVLSSSVLQHSAQPPFAFVDPEADEAMEALSSLSQMAYQNLIQHPQFLMYFNQASPVNELAFLKIGSRPARRFGAVTLSDLRAIPWVFAWSQNRHMISSWYGFGYAFENFCNIRGASAPTLLRKVMKKLPLFALCVDEVEKSLLMARMDIAKLYSGLVDDSTVSREIYNKINNEHARCVEAIQSLTELPLGQRFPKISKLIKQNEEELFWAHKAQVSLLQKVRNQKQDTHSIRIELMQSMNCISAGLGWTG